MSLIKINNENIRIRPSAVESFYGCAFQWGKAHLEGVRGRTNSRAAIGTAIHAGVEQMWTDAIAHNKTDPSISAMTDAAMEAWKEEDKTVGIGFGETEDESSCHLEIIKGTQAFVEDIVPFTAIPKAVETFFSIPLEHSLAAELGGTLDYLGDGVIADVKTSKRKSGPEGHTVQQSIYKMLAEANGHNIHTNLIQQVVLKKAPEGAILELEPDVLQAKYLVNGLLDTLDLVMKDVAPIETILRPNPKHMFCSPKFCDVYSMCPAIKGNLQPAEILPTVQL